MSALVRDPDRSRAIAAHLHTATHHLHAAVEGLRDGDAPHEVVQHLAGVTTSVEQASLLLTEAS